jgi:hypothetical protein
VTVLLAIAAYVAIVLATGRIAYRKLMTAAAFDYNDSGDRFVSGFLALVIGMFWPATLIGLALISIITAPSRGDTQ